MALALCAAPARAQEPATDKSTDPRPWDLLAHGSANELWYAVTTPASSGKSPHTFVWVRPFQGDWQLVVDFPSRLISLGDWRGQLVAGLDSGELRRVGEDVFAGLPALPGDVDALALAGHEDALWAIGIASSASPATTRAATVPTTTTAAMTTAPSSTTRPGRLALYHLQKDAWVRAALLPPTVTASDGQLLSLILLGTGAAGTPAVAYRDPAAPATARVITYTADTTSWADAGAFTLGSAQPIRKLVLMPASAARDHLAAWAVGNTGVGSFFFSGSPPTTGPATAPTPSPAAPWREKPLTVPPNVKVGDVAAVAFRDELRLLVTNGPDEKFYEQKYDAAGNDPRPITPLPSPRGDAESNFAELLSYGLLAALFVVMLVLASRSGPIAVTKLGITETALAPMSLRLAAALIDLWPLYLGQLLIFHHLGHARLMTVYTSPYNYWVLGVTIALYVIHPLVAELIWSRSLGKMCVGLRVVNRADAARATLSALLLRNLMRPLELFLILPMLVVLLNPLRQRLGDFAANTLVVGRLPPKEERRREDIDDDGAA